MWYPLMKSNTLQKEIQKRLGVLYEKHHSWLIACSYNLCKDKVDSEDMVGELYLYLAEKQNEFLFYKDSFNLKYCHLFLSSRFLNKKKRDKKIVYTTTFSEELDDEYDYEGDHRLEETWGTLKEELEELKKSRMWSSAKLYEMYQFSDMTMEELSKEIGISKSTTFLNIRKIKMHLKDKLNNPFKKEGDGK